MNWQVILYESRGGQKPVETFIKSLQSSTQAKLIRQLDLLEEFGPKLGMPHAKPVGGGLYELRVRGKQEVRVIYVFVQKQSIYLLHGFQKKSQEIAKKDLAIARNRKKEIESL